MLISLLPFFLVLLFPSFIQLATARLVNVTIDDTGLNSISNETVAYDPPDAWNSAVVCHNNPCFVKPDTTQVLNGTWHESTFHSQDTGANIFTNIPLTATVNFNGTAVYVYAVMAPNVTLNLPPSTVTFHIDGVMVGQFRNSSATIYEYNVLAYENSTLLPGSHQLIIKNGEKDGPPSLFILDRIIYSAIVDNPPPQTLQSDRIPKSTSLSRQSNPSQPSNKTTLSSTSTPFSSTSNSSMIPVSTSSQAPTSTPPPTPPPSPISTPDAENTGNPNHALPTGNVVGIALGSLAAIILILFLVLFLRRRTRLRRIADTHQIARPASFLARSEAHATGTFEGDGRVSGLPMGWVVASDSKRDLLSSVTPPAYI